MRQKNRNIRYMKASPQGVRRGAIPFTLYDTALNQMAYGQSQQMGDLFGDIMGAVVGKDNWSARPDWMKNIKVKPDPAKLFSTAAKVLPPKMVGKVVGQANQAGFDMFYNTPAGSIPINQETAEGIYSNYPTFLKTKDVFASVPWWVYTLGAGGILFAFSMRK